MKVYELAVPPRVAQAEWQEFAREDDLIRAIGEVRFDALEENGSRLTVPVTGDTLGADAVVQRFRERLRRKRLLEEGQP